MLKIKPTWYDLGPSQCSRGSISGEKKMLTLLSFHPALWRLEAVKDMDTKNKTNQIQPQCFRKRTKCQRIKCIVSVWLLEPTFILAAELHLRPHLSFFFNETSVDSKHILCPEETVQESPVGGVLGFFVFLFLQMLAVRGNISTNYRAWVMGGGGGGPGHRPGSPMLGLN